MNKKAMPAGRQGFTLVELLVVIAIISILTIITVSQFQTARRKANDVARKGDLSALSKALYMYYTDYGVFPASVNGQFLSTLWCQPGSCEFIDSGYSYMKVLPKERTGLHPFCYEVSGDFKKFALYGMLENTVDSDCKMDGGVPSYTPTQCGGNKYCYVVISSNGSLDANDNIQ